MNFNYLTKENIIAYLHHIGYGNNDEVCQIISFNEDIVGAESYVNNVFRVTFKHQKISYIVKQFLNYARDVLGEHVVYSSKRMFVEVNALQFMRELIPQALPKIYYVDDQYHVIVMEDLSDLKNIRYELSQCKQFDTVGVDVGTYLATWYFYTCDYFISAALKKELATVLDATEQKKMLHKLLFGEYSIFSSSSKRTFECAAQQLWRELVIDDTLQKVVKQCGMHFLNDEHCICHNDFHLGNVLVDNNRTCIIDAECGGYSNHAVDLGRIVGDLLLNYISWFGRSDVLIEERKVMQQHILKMIRHIYEAYNTALQLLMRQYQIVFDCQTVVKQIFDDSFSYAVITMLGRLPSDNARPCDIMQIITRETLAKVQMIGIVITHDVLQRKKVIDVDEFLNCVRKFAEI